MEAQAAVDARWQECNQERQHQPPEMATMLPIPPPITTGGWGADLWAPADLGPSSARRLGPVACLRSTWGR